MLKNRPRRTQQRCCKARTEVNSFIGLRALKTVAYGFNDPVDEPLPRGSTVRGVASDVPICDEFLNAERTEMKGLCLARTEAAHGNKRQAVVSLALTSGSHRPLGSPGAWQAQPPYGCSVHPPPTLPHLPRQKSPRQKPIQWNRQGVEQSQVHNH